MLATFADFPLRIFAIWYLSYLSSGRRIKEWNKFEKIYSNKISGDNAQEEWGNVTSLAYRTLGRPRLVGFFVPVLALFESQRGSKIHSNEISWDLFSQANWLLQVKLISFLLLKRLFFQICALVYSSENFCNKPWPAEGLWRQHSSLLSA